MTIESTISAYSNALDASLPLIDDAMKSVKYAKRQQEDALAAIRGGSSNFRSSDEVKRVCKDKRDDAIARGMHAVDKLRDSMTEVRDKALAIDCGEIAAVAPALALKLTDEDLRAIAKQYRGSRGALMVIARADGSFAASVALALDAYAEVVTAATRKAGDFSERTLRGQNGLDEEGLRSLLEGQREAIQEAWGILQGVVDGTASVDPMTAALHHAGR